jgi:hypothetical protein
MSDYFFTHFQLFTPPIGNGDFYVVGNLTNNEYNDNNKMTYNNIDHCYEAVIPLKQGTYNYMYLYKENENSVGSTEEAEGNFHQTENEYSIFVYHKPFGCRYDQLVGYHYILCNAK